MGKICHWLTSSFYNQRKIAIFLASAIIICLIIQLIGQPAFTQEATSVKVLIQAGEASQWEPIVEDFNSQNTEIKLEIIEAPNAVNQVEDLYTSSFLLGNSPYDLVYMDVSWIPKFAVAGWLRDLSERISETELAKFLSGDVDGSRYQGGLYRIPFRSDAGMLYYRTDLLARSGESPPETFSELIATAKKIQEQNTDYEGYLWQGKQYEGLSAMFVEILEGYGAFWINPETLEVGLDQPEAIKAVEFLNSTIQLGISPSGVITYTEEETRRLFQNDKAIFLRNWPYVFGPASQPDSPIRGKFAVVPMVHAPGEKSGACLGGWGLGISTTSKHPEAAWQVIKFISSEAVQRKLVLDTGYVPTLKSLFNDPEIVAKYSHYPQLLEVVENATLRPPIPQYAQASDILQRYLSAALTGKMTPEKAMQGAANETRRLLGVDS